MPGIARSAAHALSAALGSVRSGGARRTGSRRGVERARGAPGIAHAGAERLECSCKHAASHGRPAHMRALRPARYSATAAGSRGPRLSRLLAPGCGSSTVRRAHVRPRAMIVDGVLILDFGSQYTQLIARRIREQHVYCEIQPCTYSLAEVRDLAPRAIILSGGPASVFAEGAPSVDPGVFDLGVPVLGICYGMQLTSHLLGGKVEQADEREYGPARLEVLKPEGLLHGFHVGSHVDVWMSHGDRVESLPAGSRRSREPPTARSRRSRTSSGTSLGCSSIRRSRTRRAGSRCFGLSCSRWRVASRTGPRARSSSRASSRFAVRSATALRCVACPVAWIRRWRPCWCPRRSASGSPASSSTTACFEKTKPRA